jgi:hypothetical protein
MGLWWFDPCSDEPVTDVFPLHGLYVGNTREWENFLKKRWIDYFNYSWPWKRSYNPNLFEDLKSGVLGEKIQEAKLSPSEKAIVRVIVDQFAQVAAQSIAYYYIHPAVGVGLTILNTILTVTGIEANPTPAY